MTKEKLIEELVHDGYLKTQSIIDAFTYIDRADFVLEDMKEHAYVNEPLPIGFDQTISQPLTVAFMLELLSPKPGETILDIGIGSGWQTSLLAFIVGREHMDGNETPLVFGIERIPELFESAKNNIEKYHFIEKNLISIVQGDGYKGLSASAPYDKIIAAATADSIPQTWKDQLTIGGRIVAPVKESIVVLEKKGVAEFEEKSYFGFRFVPLVKD